VAIVILISFLVSSNNCLRSIDNNYVVATVNVRSVSWLVFTSQMPIEELNLSARTTNALINNEIRTIRDLVTLTEQDLRELKGFGSKALDEVRDKMAELEF
jgi:DNA-directed RNA polymerase alpha subunit